MSKFSIIVPCYNAERNIDECVKSLINQSFKDLEIILVDDCSTDNTYSKLKEYEALDSRIKVLKNDVNSGAGYSRNRGLEIANGDYIAFVDSDDFLDENAYLEIASVISANDEPDIVRINQTAFFEFSKLRISANFLTNNIFNNICGQLPESMKGKYVSLETPGVCNKIFKRSLIDETKFIVGKKWEDYPFCTLMLARAKEIVFCPNVTYHYRHSVGHSSTTLSDVKVQTPKVLEIYDVCDYLEEEFRENGMFDEYKDVVRSSQKIQASQRLRDCLFNPLESPERKKKVVNLLLNLTEIKYGDLFSDDCYLTLKKKKMFYRSRMHYIEKKLNDPSLRTDTDEAVVKQKILKFYENK